MTFRRLLLGLALLVVLGVAAAASWWWWRGTPPGATRSRRLAARTRVTQFLHPRLLDQGLRDLGQQIIRRLFLAVSAFYIDYRVLDKDTMFLPAYVVWVLFIGQGIRQVLDWVNRLVSRGYLLPSMRGSVRALLLAVRPGAATSYIARVAP